MARILFFTEDLPPHPHPFVSAAHELMRALADQQNELMVLTRYRPDRLDLPHHPRMEILQPFSNFKLREIFPLLPLLHRFSPQVIHLMLPLSSSPGWLSPLQFLPQLSTLFGPAFKALSLFDLKEERSKSLDHLVSQMDLVTVTGRYQKHLLSSRLHQKFAPPIEILPIMAKSSPLDYSPPFDHSIFLPGPPKELTSILKLKHFLKRHPGWGVVAPDLLEGAGPLQKRKIWRNLRDIESQIHTPQMPSSLAHNWNSRSPRLLFLAHLALGSSLLPWFLTQARHDGIIPVITSVQAGLWEAHWQDGVNCVFPDGLVSLTEKALDKMSACLREQRPRPQGDALGNWLNRTYLKHIR